MTIKNGKSNLSLNSQFYVEVRNKFARIISALLRPGNTALLLKKSRIGDETLATLCPNWPTHDLKLRSPAPETNALSLDQLAGISKMCCF